MRPAYNRGGAPHGQGGRARRGNDGGRRGHGTEPTRIATGGDATVIGKLNHVAIAVPNLDAAAAVYRDTLGATVSAPAPLPEQGVTTVFVELPNSKIELIHPLGEGSPIEKFLERNPKGGIHHVCYEVQDIAAAIERLAASGMTVLGDGKPSIGAHGLPVVFLHPKDFCGTLVELEEVAA